MRCAEAKKLLSPYLDGAGTGQQMRAMEDHLAECARCCRDYELLGQTRRLVLSLGRKPAPANLHWQLRAALSRELANSRRRFWDGFLTRSENALNAFLVPATAGVLSAIICFGLLIGSFVIPAQVHPSAVRSGALGFPTQLDKDVPTALYSPPQLRSSPFESGVGNISADSIVLEAYIDARGRVQDYKILAAPKDIKQHLPQLNNMLIFTIFRPAMAFGRPTMGKAVLSFSKISVKG